MAELLSVQLDAALLSSGGSPVNTEVVQTLNDKGVQWYCDDNCFPLIAKQYSLLIESMTIELSSLKQVARSNEKKIDELKEKNVEVRDQLKHHGRK